MDTRAAGPSKVCSGIGFPKHAAVIGFVMTVFTVYGQNNRGVEFFVGLEDVYKVIRHPGPLFEGRFRRSYIEIFIYLKGVRA